MTSKSLQKAAQKQQASKQLAQEGSVIYLLDKDFDVSVLPGGPFGHSAVLIENPDGSGYTYLSFGPGGANLNRNDNLTEHHFATLDEARATLTAYDYALEFRASGYHRLGAIEHGGTFQGKAYFPNSSILGYNCCEVSGGVINSAGIDWKFSRSPIKSYNNNADKAFREYAPWAK